jgi:glucose/mannose-6-phosphate isomerase
MQRAKDIQKKVKRLDSKNVLASTESFFEQCRQIWDYKNFTPLNLEDKKHIIFCGMGGSAYGGYVARALFNDSLPVPLISHNDYGLPGFANRDDSAVIAASYSGSTEETISAAKEAIKRKISLTGITTGGALAQLFKEQNLPYIHIDPKYNASGQPRLGTGYMVIGTIKILKEAGILNLQDKQILSAIKEAESYKAQIKQHAKEIAERIGGYTPLFIAAQFLTGNLHIARNQFNETAKSDAEFNFLPELNHHQMEGLKNPKNRRLCAVIFRSSLYSTEIKKRLEATIEVLKKNKVKCLEYDVPGSTKIAQTLTLLAFSGFASFYLAMIYNEDPGVIPWVDYFKKIMLQKS